MITDKKILLIEDDNELRGILRAALVKEGAEVLEATDAATGLKLVKSKSPDLVVLDLENGPTSSETVMKEMQESWATRYIPVLVLTKKQDEASRQNYLTIGARDYIIKNQLSPSVIAARIKRELDETPKHRFRNHFKKASKKEFISLSIKAFLLLGCLTLLYYSGRLVYLFQLQLFDQSLKQVESGLTEDLSQLRQQSIDLATNEDVLANIKQQNTIDLIAVLNEMIDKQKFGMAIVTDKDGVELVRTNRLSERGTYLFETSSWGRAVASGKTVASIEPDTILPLMMIAGQSVQENSVPIGAVFTGRTLDNNYAQDFKRRFLHFLPWDVQVAFYSTKQGIIASSFSDGANSLLSAHFNTGSDWFGRTGSAMRPSLVEISGKTYFVGNFVFPGLEENAGGALIFFPYGSFNSNAMAITLVAGLIILTIFALLFWQKHIVKHEIVKLAFRIGFVFVVAVIINELFIVNRIEKPFVLAPVSETLYNSTLSLSPSFSIFDSALDQQISIIVSTGGENINAVRSIVHYDPTSIQIDRIVTANSFCRYQHTELFLEKLIDNEKGEVIISCGLPNPGFSGEQGTVAELIARPLKNGQTIISLADNSEVLANDGLGTNVLRSSSGASYYITTKTFMEKQSQLLQPIMVFSTSHPNNNEWYNGKQVIFSWFGPASMQFAFAFDNSPYTVPTQNNTTDKNSVSFTADKDGVYYFHIATLQDNTIGPTQHYRVQIDTTPPDTPVIKASKDIVNANEVVRFEFESNGGLSGLQPNYYVRIDNSEFLPVRSPLFVPFADPGVHKVAVKVFDRAGNMSESEKKIEVKSGSYIGRIINFNFSN